MVKKVTDVIYNVSKYTEAWLCETRNLTELKVKLL